MKLKRLLVSAALALGILGGATVSSAPANAASYGYVYISLPTWMGNCAGGAAGSVKVISGAVSNVSSVSLDSGDDLVYMKVRLGVSQAASFTAYCKKWPTGSWQPGIQQTIRPTRNNQTVWMGPAGVRYN